jgi:hypothetical protein
MSEYPKISDSDSKRVKGIKKPVEFQNWRIFAVSKRDGASSGV